MAAPLPPVRLRRNISKSLDSITDAIHKYEKSKAPVLPPRPQRRGQQVGKQKPLPRPFAAEYETVLPSDAPRPNFLSKFSAKIYDLETFCKEVSLPRAIEITDGFCSPTEDIPIGFQMTIYFQKTARVVQARDSLNSSYNIPLGSSLKFAPIDELKPANSQTGFYYETVESMLMERPSLPKVAKVKHAFTKGRHSVMSNDIIFPRKIERNILGNKIVGLVCTKMNGEDIKLPLECSCGFSTATKDTQLYIMEYINHVNQFPVTVAVFGDLSGELTVAMPSKLTLLKEHMLKSLIARSRYSETEQIVEIPIDLPIQLKCLEGDICLEHERVKKTYETFDPSLVSNYYSLAETNSQHRAQQQLYSRLRSDMAGKKYYNLAAPVQKNVGSSDLERLEAIYEPIPDTSKPVLQRNHQTQYVSLLPNIHTPSSQYASLTGQDNNKPLAVTSPDLPKDTITSPTPEENIAYLKMMDVDHILQLLEDMNMSQYKDSFQHEQVDGELLVELTVEELEDLGVTKKIHQRRLMKLMDGSSSAKKYEGGTYDTLS